MQIEHIELSEANLLVTTLHRHHKAATGHRFSVGVRNADGVLVGAAIVGRPVARMTDQRNTVEVIRLVTDGTAHACSMLYGAAARAARELGYRSIQTFILESEPGTSLRAAGWVESGTTRGGDSWGTGGRGRVDHAPIEAKRKFVKILRPCS